MDSKEIIKWKDGKSYPLIRLEICIHSSLENSAFTTRKVASLVSRKNMQRSELRHCESNPLDHRLSASFRRMSIFNTFSSSQPSYSHGGAMITQQRRRTKSQTGDRPKHNMQGEHEFAKPGFSFKIAGGFRVVEEYGPRRSSQTHSRRMCESSS